MTEGGLDERDSAIVNAFQGGFPVVQRPFAAAAEALSSRGVDVDEQSLLARIRELDEEGTLSRFGPLIDAEAIGGTATLVAMHAPEDRYEEVAEAVNAHREVAHNYERDHPRLNMWFVVSVADEDGVADVLDEIESETGQETYNMPKQREFQVEAKFGVDGPLADDDVDLSHLGPTPERTGRDHLTPDERDLVLAVQDGLPLTETPYADVAADLGRDVDWVIETLRRFNEEGKIRRIGVVPNHYALGYTENGMTVWDVPDDLVDDVGAAVAALPFVTHCYERPRHGSVWEYNVFAMVHGRSEEECTARIEEVRDVVAEYVDLDDGDWDTLFSTRILKKTGIRLEARATANTASAPETDGGAPSDDAE